MTILNNRPGQALTGIDLLNRVKELGDIDKSELVLACGYVKEYKEDGTPVPFFTAFYEALLDAKGVALQLPEKQEEQEEPLLSGLSIEGFANAVVEHIGETRKLLPYNMPVVDKLCALTQMAALLTHHQRMVQDLEQKDVNTKAWMDDIEKLDMCIKTLVSVDLGDDDYWYKANDQAPKMSSKEEDELEKVKEENKAMKLLLTDPDKLADYTNRFFGPEGPYPTPTAEEKASNKTTIGLQVFTDVVKKANALQAEVDQLKQQLGECQAKNSGLLHWLFPATF